MELPGPLRHLRYLQPIYLFTGESKPSHQWTWKKQPISENFTGTLVEGDKNAFKPSNYLEMLYAFSRLGWQQIRVLHLDEKSIDHQRLQELTSWNYGYIPGNREFLDVCSVPIKPDKYIKVLNGPDPFWIVGVGSDNKEVPLSISNALYRRNKNYSDLPLF